MSRGDEKRRLARFPVRCSVAVREKLATWVTETEDVGRRGCRIALKRSLSPGALLDLALDGAEGAEPLVALGQVAWVRRTAPLCAGITFLTTPRTASGAGPASWIDRLVIAQLRRALACGAAGPASLGQLGGVALHLATQPAPTLLPEELAFVAVARCGGPISTAGLAADGLGALAGLMERGVVTVCPDPGLAAPQRAIPSERAKASASPSRSGASPIILLPAR